MLNLLLDARADPGIQPKNRFASQFSPLHWSSEQGFLQNIEVFMNRCPDLALKGNEMNYRPWTLAAVNGKASLLRYFHAEHMRHIDIESDRDAWGGTLLCNVMIGTCDTDTLRVLLDLGYTCRNRIKPTTGLTKALVKVSKLSCYMKEAPGELLQMAANQQGAEPLLVASYFGRLGLVEMLLEHGADFRAVNSYRRTSLMLAASRGHEAVVDLLLKHGARDVSVDAWGLGAADWAQRRGCFELAQKIRASSVDELAARPRRGCCAARPRPRGEPVSTPAHVASDKTGVLVAEIPLMPYNLEVNPDVSEPACSPKAPRQPEFLDARLLAESVAAVVEEEYEIIRC